MNKRSCKAGMLSLPFCLLPLLLLLPVQGCRNDNSGKYTSINSANASTGKVIGVVDGDTYDLLTPGKETLRIRMAAIDAPERGMTCYKEAKERLAQWCFGKEVRIERIGKDRNSRIIAFTWLKDGTELSRQMIADGYAWHFKAYSSDTMLNNLEKLAKLQKIGLWAYDKPVPPWEFRQAKKHKHNN